MTALDSPIEQGGSGDVTISTSNLESTRLYSISVEVSGGIYLNDTCSPTPYSLMIPPKSTESSHPITIYGCDAGVGTLTVTLGGATSPTIATQEITVFPTFSSPSHYRQIQ